MGKGNRVKQLIAYLLTFCMMISCLGMTNMGNVQAAEADGTTETTTVYFYNSDGWDEIRAHIYNAASDAANTEWPGMNVESASDEYGENWWKVDVPSAPNFTIIFNNNNQGKQAPDTIIKDNTNVFVNASENMAYENPQEAIVMTTVYFYNDDEWSTVNAYAYYGEDSKEIFGGWPGTVATDIGDNWWKIDVPRNVDEGEAFNIIFNGVKGEENVQKQGSYVTNSTYVYTNATEETVYGTTAGAEGKPITTLYFLNSDDWADVRVHAWINGNENAQNMLGNWPGTAAAPAEEIGTAGENWMKIEVPSAPAFNVIISDNGGTQMTTWISDEKVFLTKQNDLNYATAAEAEDAIKALENGNESGEGGNENPTASTTVYFYNNHNWAAVSAYVYHGSSNVETFGGWPGEAAEEATDMGEGWWKKEVPLDVTTTPFTIIFNNNGNSKQTANLFIENSENVYTNANGEVPYTSKEAAEEAATEPPEDYTTIQNGELTLYFYNNANWDNVYAYSYGGESYVPDGEEWPGALAKEATDMGNNWWKVTVKAESLFSIIFHDNTGNRVERSVSSTRDIYFSATGMVYQSPEELEIALGVGATDENSTTVYFKKNSDWGNIYGYVYINDAPYGASWPGVPAMDASEELESQDWWKIIVPKVATAEDSFNVIFTDSMAQTNGILIDDQENVYIIPDSQVFDNVEEADAEAAKYIPLFDKDEPNEDLENYDVEFDGAGASQPYITYEAEAADTNATVLEKNTEYLTMQSEASGRQAVKLEETGNYVEFTLTEAANAFVLRYSMPDSEDGTGVDASLSMYADGEESDLALTSKYAWIYGDYPYVNNPSAVSTGSNQVEAHRFFDEIRGFFGKTLPAGTKIKLQKNAEDTAEYYVIDFIECEMVGAPGTQPENSLSITDEAFGAVADDGMDDAAAINVCITAAKAQGKEVWIPEGTFNVTDKKAFVVDGVTIRGAGMWYSNLEGAGASFHYKGICKFYDFAMTGVSDIRKDADDLAGFEGKGAALNVTIQNIWMEHMKVGVWSRNSKHLVVQGCRIRNTYADGINLSSKTVDSVVRNNSIRNTGDDGIACWPETYNSTGNTIEHNTVQVPTLANGIIVYGGGDNAIQSNYVADTVVNGSGVGVGSEFTTSDGFTGAITIANNELYRCGSYHKDRAYPVGAIWVWASNGPMTTKYDIINNNLYDCSKEAFLLDCWSNLSGVTLKDNNVDGATDGILVRGNEKNSAVTGSATVENIPVKDCTGELVVNENPEFFTIVTTGKGIYNYVSANGIGLDHSTLSLEEGATAQLTATVEPENVTDATVTWTSSDASIVTVVEDGTVTAVKVGTATITATTVNGKTATCEVTVTATNPTEPTEPTEPTNPTEPTEPTEPTNPTEPTEPDDKPLTVAVTGITLTSTAVELEVGGTSKLVATVAPDNATDKTVTWTSSDEKVATVVDGTVTAVAPGKATITAKAGDKTATCEVTVKEAIKEPEEEPIISVKSVKVSTVSKNLAIGTKVIMKATVNPSNADVESITWSIREKDKKYASINAETGKLSIKKAGAGKSIKVYATVTGKDSKTVKSKGYTINIKKHKVKKVTIAGKSIISVKYSKKKVQLKATVKASGKSVNKKLKWTSSNTKYATVNSKGVVTFKEAGKGEKVTITATAMDGTGKKDKVTIKIKK